MAQSDAEQKARELLQILIAAQPMIQTLAAEAAAHQKQDSAKRKLLRMGGKS